MKVGDVCDKIYSNSSVKDDVLLQSGIYSVGKFEETYNASAIPEN